jgi:hypothetical protein
MSTQTATHDDKGTKEPDPNRLLQCPVCHAFVHFNELGPYQPIEYPKAMFKVKPPEPPPGKAEPEPEVETIVVNDPEEEQKKAGEGWSKDPPKPKGAQDKAAAHPQETHKK